MRELHLHHKRRPWQREAARNLLEHRFAVIVAHRRAGKTVEMAARLLLAALRAPLRNPPHRYAYVAPLLKQAKTIAWGYLVRAARQMPQARINEGELWIEPSANGARISLFGADNPDSLRGQYLDGAVLDEVGQMKPDTWQAVLRPCLADYSGWCVFIGTPKGRNLFFELYNLAGREPGWWRGIYPASRTGIIPPEELKRSLAEMGDDLYRQEFECDFSAANPNSLIPFDLIQAAAGKHLAPTVYQSAPKILGLDVARFGDDQSVILRRQGLAVPGLKKYRGLDLMDLAGRTAAEINQWRPDAVFVDAVGLGAGVVDRLGQLGHAVIGISAGAKAAEDRRFSNLRAEMWWKIKNWLLDGGALPQDPGLLADLGGLTYSYDHSGRLTLQSKEDLKKQGQPSPDCGDALALTFAQPVAGPEMEYKTPPADYDPLEAQLK